MMTPELKEKIRAAVYKCVGGGILEGEPLKDMYECRDYPLYHDDCVPVQEFAEIYDYEDHCLKELCEALREGKIEIWK